MSSNPTQVKSYELLVSLAKLALGGIGTNICTYFYLKYVWIIYIQYKHWYSKSEIYNFFSYYFLLCYTTNFNNLFSFLRRWVGKMCVACLVYSILNRGVDFILQLRNMCNEFLCVLQKYSWCYKNILWKYVFQSKFKLKFL